MGDDRDGGASQPARPKVDHRSVPVEDIRELARDQAELSSLRVVAEQVGLGRTTLHKFISGNTMPQPRVRRLLALWYLRQTGVISSEEHEAELRTRSAALKVLLSGVPTGQMKDARSALLDELEQAHVRAGVAVPGWIAALRAREQGGGGE